MAVSEVGQEQRRVQTDCAPCGLSLSLSLSLSISLYLPLLSLSLYASPSLSLPPPLSLSIALSLSLSLNRVWRILTKQTIHTSGEGEASTSVVSATKELIRL